jgi:hypothetical protein
MAEAAKNPCPPYATFSALLNFINKLRDTQVPARIDPSAFGNASGSLSYSIIAALKSLKLIGSDGVPTADFVTFVNADEEARKPLLREAMKIAYPTLHGDQFPIKNATAGQFDEHIRENYEAKGSTIDKVAAFFIAAAEYAGITISDLIKARKPIASSPSSARSKKQRKAAQEPETVGGTGAVLNKQPQTPITEKALEYRLVDLMSDAIDKPEVMQAIITVVTFLKARDAKPAKTAADQ